MDLGPWPHERAWQRTFFRAIERPVARIVVATSKPQKDWLPSGGRKSSTSCTADYGLQPCSWADARRASYTPKR
jgi:heptosyltransferase I